MDSRFPVAWIDPALLQGLRRGGRPRGCDGARQRHGAPDHPDGSAAGAPPYSSAHQPGRQQQVADY